MAFGTILVVCTGNICRSPVAAAVLADRLGTSLVAVRSAGTHAMIDHHPADETGAFIRRELGRDAPHRGVQLTRAESESADLILTMTEEQRTWVARTAPRVVRRTFTLLELAQIVRVLPHDARFADLRRFSEECARLRTCVRDEPRQRDIPDPYGGPPAGYESSFRQVTSTSRAVAAEIASRVAAV